MIKNSNAQLTSGDRNGLRLLFLVIACLISFSGMAAVSFTTQPYLQKMTQEEVTVMWIASSAECIGWVEWGENGKLTQRTVGMDDGLIRAYTKINCVTLDGLQPNTTYTYRACIREITGTTDTGPTYGETTYSNRYTFTTPGFDDERVTTIIFNDIHNNALSFTGQINFQNIPEFDFAFFNGDIINSTPDENTIVFNFIRPCAATFASEKPFMTVRGNHEFRNAFARNYFDYFRMEGDNKGYFSFSRGPVFFIALDSGEDKEDASTSYSGLGAFEAYREEQAVWLEEQLKSEACKNALYKVVLMHIPTYTNTTKEEYGMVHCRELFEPLFNQYEIDVLISGHTHKVSVMQPQGNRKYPIVVGGGTLADEPLINNSTMISLTADKNMLDIIVFDQFGKKTDEFTILHREPEAEGNMFLYRLGDGSSALNTTNAYPVFLDEYKLEDDKAELVRTIPMPVESQGNNKRFTAVGSDLNLNFLSRSADGLFLLAGGYDAEPGSRPASQSATEVNRVVAIVNAEGQVNTTTSLNNVFNTNGIRSVASTNGSDIWLSGADGAYYTTAGGSTALLLNNTTQNTQNLKIYDDLLYVSTGTAVYNMQDALPTVAGQSFIALSGSPVGTGGMDFALIDTKPENPGEKLVLYWVSGTNEISKYSLRGDKWALSGTYALITRPRALEAIMKDGIVQLYIVSSANTSNGVGRLHLLEDFNGHNYPMRGGLTQLLDISGDRTTIRGLAWAPQPGGTLGINKSPHVSSFRLFVGNNALFVEIENVAQADIYNLFGQKIKSVNLIPGINEVTGLDKNNIYLVKVGGETMKIIL